MKRFGFSNKNSGQNKKFSFVPLNCSIKCIVLLRYYKLMAYSKRFVFVLVFFCLILKFSFDTGEALSKYKRSGFVFKLKKSPKRSDSIVNNFETD